MFRTSLITKGLLATVLWVALGNTGFADITSPTEDEQYANSANIAVQGDGGQEQVYIIKLVRAGGVVQDSHEAETGVGGTWETEFNPPTGGWPVANDTIEQWYGANTIHSVPIQVVQN